ncbi:MAG TPA: hypothetical protein VE962_08365 [Actinomycetota bacterium]|nr:hypothetical protein [Actinomycetota bacterium]
MAVAAPFERLDFLYVPSRDVAADRDTFVNVLGGRLLFAVESMGTRIAGVELTDGPPMVLLTDHLEGDRPVLVYRVPDLDAALRELETRGWERAATFEIPQGPCCSFVTPGGHRIALYQLTRPEAAGHFDGRRDF